MSAPTIAQACVVAIVAGGTKYYQEGTGWTATSANATLYATLAAAQNRAEQLQLSPSAIVACAAPALCLQNWTAR